MEQSLRESLITTSVLEFLNKHIQSSQQNTLDEIILDYVVSVVDILASETGSLKDFFDVTEFCEMLTGYFNGFESIPHEVVSNWIFDLVDSLKKQAEEAKRKKEPLQFEALLNGFGSVESNEHEHLDSASSGFFGRSKYNSESSHDGAKERERLDSTTSGSSKRSKSNSESSYDCPKERERTPSNGSGSSRRCKRNSKSSSEGESNNGKNVKSGSSYGSTNGIEWKTLDDPFELEDNNDLIMVSEEVCAPLLEMFPSLTLKEARAAVYEAKFDVQVAADRIVQRMENPTETEAWLPDQTNGIPRDSVVKIMSNGLVFDSTVKTRETRPRVIQAGGILLKGNEVNEEKVMKDRIFARYGFIDKEEDKKEFRPPPVKTEPKKMVRYRESQVVSTKGERYSEVRCKDGGEIKPYLHKPKKQNN